MQILYLLLAKRYWFLTTEKLIWISNSFLEEERHCFCQLRTETALVPSDFPTSFLMSTLTSAVLSKSLFGNAARRNSLPSSSWSVPCLTQWMNLLLLIVLYVKGRENPSQSLSVSAVENLGNCSEHHQHIPEVLLLSFAFFQRAKCWFESSLNKAMIHLLSSKIQGFFKINCNHVNSFSQQKKNWYPFKSILGIINSLLTEVTSTGELTVD